MGFDRKRRKNRPWLGKIRDFESCRRRLVVDGARGRVNVDVICDGEGAVSSRSDGDLFVEGAVIWFAKCICWIPPNI